MSRIAAVQSDTTGRFRPRLLPVFLAVLLPACATAPSRTAVVRSVPVPPTPVAAIYVYPAAGQSAARLDRDRYACHLWAVQQSRFDPGLPDLAPHQRIEVRAMPAPGAATAAGAVTGAVLGALVSGPHRTAQGAVVGAVAGGVIGAAADSARQEEADAYNQAVRRQDSRLQAVRQQQANDYRRAISACLEGRGYTVK